MPHQRFHWTPNYPFERRNAAKRPIAFSWAAPTRFRDRVPRRADNRSTPIRAQAIWTTHKNTQKFMRSIDRTRPPHNNSHKPYCLPLLPDKILNTKDPNPIWVHVRYEATGRFGPGCVLGLSFQTQQPPSGTPCLAHT